ncbi:MAG: hypothetical protein ACP5SD_03275 [Elusimicrobiales bacterium]
MKKFIFSYITIICICLIINTYTTKPLNQFSYTNKKQENKSEELGISLKDLNIKQEKTKATLFKKTYCSIKDLYPDCSTENFNEALQKSIKLEKQISEELKPQLKRFDDLVSEYFAYKALNSKKDICNTNTNHNIEKNCNEILKQISSQLKSNKTEKPPFDIEEKKEEEFTIDRYLNFLSFEIIAHYCEIEKNIKNYSN